MRINGKNHDELINTQGGTKGELYHITKDEHDNLVLGDSVGTITNKTIDANDNTITNLEHGVEVDNPSSGVHGVVGSIVGTTDAQTLSDKTLVEPIIVDFTNATHSHEDDASGGVIVIDESNVTFINVLGHDHDGITSTKVDYTSLTSIPTEFTPEAHTHKDAVTGGVLSHADLTSIGTNTHANIDTHISNVTTNPHAITKANVGLQNVTDDSQLKRSSGDLNSFDEKSSAVVDDILIIEDSTDGFSKKKVKISSLPFSSGSGDVISQNASVDGNIVIFDGITGKIIKDGGKGLPTGDVIGTTDAQTLSNKTLTSPIISDYTSATHTHKTDATGGTIAHGDLTEIGTTTHADIDTHIDNITTNPHAVTKANVGLGNVTNDSQLKRGAKDFEDFVEKLNPTTTDKILIEDSDDNGEKKYIQVSNLPFSSSTGNVTGVSSSIDNAIVTWDGITGNVLKDSTKLLPTGDIVGLTDVQTLTNKTITSPKVNENVDLTATSTELNYVAGVTSDIQSQFTGKAQTDHASTGTTYGISTATDYGHAMASSATPIVAGSATLGVETAKFARGDHVHPAQTSVTGESGKAVILSNERTIGISGGATGTATGFDGSQNITIPVTSLDATKLNGLVPITSIPPASIERLIIVADDIARFALTLATAQNGDTVKVTDTGLMYFITDDTNLNIESGYEIYTAGSASSVPWSGITGTPLEFPPSAHGHLPSEVGLSTVTNDAQLKRSSGDINSFDTKITPVNADVILIEDSESNFDKKKISINSLPYGSGDVDGASSSVDGNVVLFDGITGKVLKDGGKGIPTGDIVGTSDTQTLGSKTLTTPTIASFVNANHTHEDSANGGIISLPEARVTFDNTTGHTHNGTDATKVDYADLTSIPNDFVPASHAVEHGELGSDPVSLTEAQVTFDASTGHDHDGVDSTQVSAGNVLIDSIGTSIDSVQELFQHTLSAGALEPTTITPDGVSGTVDILGYKAIFRTSDDQLAPIVVANVPAVTGLAVPEGISYIVAQYNAGTPTTSIVTDYSTISFNDAFIQGRCCKDGADLCTIVSGMHVYNYPYRDIRRLQETRALEQASGLAMSNPSDFYLKITPGVVYSNFERFTIPAFDSSGTDTFSHVYKNDLGTFTRVDNLTQLNAYYYVGASGIPTAIGQNQFSVFWVYSRPDGKVIVQYGTNAFNSQSAAEASPIPEAPPKFASMMLLIGQIVCKRSESQMFSMRSAFVKKFIPAPVVTHNSLSGMQGGKVDEYFHASQAIAGGWTLNKFNATVDPTSNEDTGDGYSVGSEWVNVTDNKTFVCTDATSTSAVWEQTNASGGPAIVAGDAGKGLAVKSDESDGEWVHAKRTILLSGAGGWASTIDGDAGVTQVEMTTNGVDIVGINFPSSVSAAYHQYHFVMPVNYDGGTITARFYWTTNDVTPSGDISWKIQGQSYSDNDPLDAVWGVAVEVVDTIIAQNNLHISTVSEPMTIANAPIGGDMIAIRVMRDGSDVSDTSSNDVSLLGVLISYGTDNYSDV